MFNKQGGRSVHVPDNVVNDVADDLVAFSNIVLQDVGVTNAKTVNQNPFAVKIDSFA
jgi:hypothetical protein